jgi:SAM-dependent methyltransferase
MSPVQSLSDPRYVGSQYRTAANLNARLRLHQLFSTNKYGWQRWLFDRFQLPPGGSVLELGCGDGQLWRENLDRLPGGVEILLSDLSAGMLQQARENLANHAYSRNAGLNDGFQFQVIDAQSIPYGGHHFDVVIASHMLYHVPDRAKALPEVRRTLKPGGYFYASTNGQDSLRELTDLVARFDPGLAEWGRLPSGSFSLENGAAQLREYFSTVELFRYPDALVVTDPAPLVEYILSGRIELSPERQAELAGFVRQQVQADGGKFYITKEAGVFEAR